MNQPPNMIALEEANRIRFARADLKRDLRARRVTLVEALDHPDVGSMPVCALLCAQYRWGLRRAKKALADAGTLAGSFRPISEMKQIGSLTDRQKRALLQACGESERSAVA